jgi:DNA-binding transcriptional regulator YiaG
MTPFEKRNRAGASGLTKENKLSQSKAVLKLKVSARTLQEWEQDRSARRHLALETLREKIAR